MSETEDKQRSKRRGADKLAKAEGSGTSSRPTAETTQLAVRTKPQIAKTSVDSAGSRGEHKPGKDQRRKRSLEKERAARKQGLEYMGNKPNSDPAKKPPIQYQDDRPEQSRSRSRRGRDESPPGNRSRHESNAPTGGRGVSSRREERRPRSRVRSRSKNRRQSNWSRVRRSLSRVRRSLSGRRGGDSSDESPERERSLTRISNLAQERSILFSKKRGSHQSFEYLVEEARRGTWKKKPALYLRINIVMGRGKKDFENAWFRFEFRGEDSSWDATVVKFYPEKIEGPLTPQGKEGGLDAGVQLGVPQAGLQVTGNVTSKENVVVEHRCRLNVTDHRGRTGIVAHLRKDGTYCTMPSRVQVQLVVQLGSSGGLEIVGTLDLQDAREANGAWKSVDLESYREEARDFAKWTVQDWKRKGDNTPLEGPGTPGI